MKTYTKLTRNYSHCTSHCIRTSEQIVVFENEFIAIGAAAAPSVDNKELSKFI